MSFKFQAFFGSSKRAPGMSGIDNALARISLIDDVVGTQVNHNGTVTIFVRENVDRHYPKIVAIMQKHAPGVRGEVRSAPMSMLQGPATAATAETLLH